MATHIPNPDTYRPWLGVAVNRALLRLVEHRNHKALQPLSASDYLEKAIANWWRSEFPGEPVPFETKRYDLDLEI